MSPSKKPTRTQRRRDASADSVTITKAELQAFHDDARRARRDVDDLAEEVVRREDELRDAHRAGTVPAITARIADAVIRLADANPRRVAKLRIQNHLPHKDIDGHVSSIEIELYSSSAT